MPLRALLILFALLLLPGEPASAAKVAPWRYDEGISWRHPDGRRLPSNRIISRVYNDTLEIFRNRNGSYHARFTFRNVATLFDQRSRFFILDRADHKTARRIYLEIDARAWPKEMGGGGLVVGQLTKRDIATLRKYAGNLLGASYYSRKPGETGSRLRHYNFTGEGFRAALDRLTGTSSPALGESLAGSSGSSTSSASGSSAATFVGFNPKWTSCSRPSLSNINSNRSADRVFDRTKRWLKCRERNETKARRQMIEHYGKAGIRITYGKEPDGGYKYRWRAKKHQNEIIGASVEKINAYATRTTRFAKRSRRAIERWDRRARRNNARRTYTPPSYNPSTTYRPAPTYRPPVIIQRGVQ